MRIRTAIGALDLAMTLLVACILAALSATTLLAQAQEASDRSLFFQVLRDATPVAGIEDICCGADDAFDDQRVSHVSTTYGGGPIWLKIAPVEPDGVLRLTPMLDAAELFQWSDDTNTWTRSQTGDSVDFTARDFETPFQAFAVNASPATKPLYLRIRQDTALTIRLMHYTKDRYQSIENTDRTAKIFLFGFVISIVAYNLLFAGFVRDIAYFLNAVTISSLLCFSLYMSGFGFAYFWPSYPQLSNPILILSLFCSVTFGSSFLWMFIKNRTEPIRNGWPFLIPILTATAALLLTLVAPYWWSQRLLLISAALTFTVALSFAIARTFAGHTQAKILLIPMGCAMIPGLSTLALDKIFGLRVPWAGENTLELTLCLEAVLYSLVLAIRIRTFEKDRERMMLQNMTLRTENLRKTMATQDVERQRIAKELHDSVGQEFLVVLGSLKKLLRDGTANPWRPSLEKVERSASSALDEVRRISRDMHPASLAHLGLKKSLISLAENMQRGRDLTITTDMTFSETRLSPTENLHIYRIIQECLSNVIRHAQASHCRVSLVERKNGLTTVIEDDGIGFDAGHGSKTTTLGLGLTSISERVLSLNGQWRMTESDMGGALLQFEFTLGTQQDANSDEA